MTTDIVFAGPTLAAAEIAALLPAAVILPPVRHGDLLRLDACSGDRVLIIDGLFLQAASVRHREILLLLEGGVTVAGGSSMGALRAAELWQFGMRGFGEIFRLYRDGVIDGDDEVAIVHGTGDDDHHSYSEPLVNIRIALRDAVADCAISDEAGQLMLDLAMTMPFRSRSFRALDLVAAQHVSARTAEAFRAWRAGRDTDVKAADARLLLAAAAAGDPRLCPAGADDVPIRNVHTRLLDMWQHHYHGGETGEGDWVSDAEAATAIRLAHPEFPRAHRQYVLACVAGTAPQDPAAAASAVAAARARGLLPRGPELADSWLTERDLALPADAILTTLLVRAFGTHHGQAGSDLPPELMTASMLAWGRRFAAAAHRCNEGLLRPAAAAAGRRRFRAEAVNQAFATVWGCDSRDLQAYAWDRGIPDLATFRKLAEPFVAHLKVFGVPDATGAMPG